MEYQHEEKKKRDYLLPASILIAALLVGGALIYSVGKNSAGSNAIVPEDIGNPLLSLSKVTSDDHIIGKIDAPIKIVLFSDTECPFCKDFHITMQQVMRDYGDKVAWVYRHAPIDGLHPKARNEAEATECAADLGGNEVFWKYLDRIMEITPSNNGLDASELPKIAEYVGINVTKFNICLSGGEFSERVQKNLDEAITVGMQGTPYAVIVINNIPRYALPGAIPYEEEVSGQPYMRLIIEELLKEV